MDLILALLRAVLFVVIAYAVVFVAALVNIVFERRALAFMQDRHGPNRTGPHGVLQSIADAFKMMGKEDFRPALADPWLFTLAPIMVMIGAVAVQLVLPYTRGLTGQTSTSASSSSSPSPASRRWPSCWAAGRRATSTLWWARCAPPRR